MSRISHSRVPLVLIGLTLISGLLVTVSRAAEEEKEAGAKSVPAKVADLSWMSGCWRGTMGPDTVEESWGQPVNGSMVGTFRWIKEGGAWMYELIAIRQDGDTIDYRFKHFDNKLVGWEENDKPLTLTLEQIEERKVVFGSTGETKSMLITYHRVSDDEMHIQVGPREPGQGRALSFKLSRVREGS